ncbi:MAG: tetratricopeptide repeat protein [Calditrichaceae bacterium]|nr:tetratricopeptide repeat protein [Calditrichaceae bacterium]
MYKIINLFTIFLILFILGCAYYNTFFNAKEYYKTGENKQKNSTNENVSSDVRTSYENAIKKCWKLIDTYGDSSDYADDALLLIGKSHYNIREYELSAKVLNQFLLKYLNSKLIPDAKLWLAKNYIELEKENEALDLLDNIFDNKVSNEVAAQAFYILGNLYFYNMEYEKAIDKFQQCVEITDDDEIKGDAEYKTGESFFILEEYENALYHFEKIQKLDVPVIKEYQAIMQKVNALSKLERYEEADQILRLMLSNIRFQEQFSLIETKLANISEIQGDIDYAMELYYDILKKYPKKEGAALSAFYLGQLYEFEFGNFDSAKVYYDRVNKEYNQSEAKEDATARANLLKEYLTIRDQINKDKGDLFKLQRGDSLLIDSIAVEPSTEDTLNNVMEETQQQFADFDDVFKFPSDTDQDTTLSDTSNSILQDSLLQQATTTKSAQKKKAVTRDPAEVESSLIKNSFAIAEYFLLKYQNYDSSLTRYSNFINNFSDSVFTPKALYSVYFLYNDIYKDDAKADSIKQIILEHYLYTPYGEKLSGKISDINENLVKNSTELSKIKYHEAEDYFDKRDFNNAIELFTQIAEKDSGSIWAQKSRYAIAYTYEKYIMDTALAIQSYQILANRYPKTEYGKIASNKIAEPGDEIIEQDTSGQDTDTQNDTSADTATKEEGTDYMPVDPDKIIDIDMLDSKRPLTTFRNFDDSDKEKTKNIDKKILRENAELINRRDRKIFDSSQSNPDSTKIIN